MPEPATQPTPQPGPQPQAPQSTPTRRTFLGAAAGALAAVPLLGSRPLSGHRPHQGGPLFTSGPFQLIRLPAGGLVTMVAVLKGGGGKMFAGADVAGYFNSTDYGDHWSPQQAGIYQVSGDHTFLQQCADIVYSATETTPQVVYALAGDSSNDTAGGFLAFTDGGTAWSVRSTAVSFSGNHAASPLPSAGYPRSTGHLLAQDPAGYLYCYTYDKGVYRSTTNGTSWTSINGTTLTGNALYGRSLVIDPKSATTLYAAPYNDKVWKCTNAHATTPSWTQLTHAPALVESLVALQSGTQGTILYAACGTGGFYRSTDNGSTWTQYTNARLPAASYWSALTGYVSGSSHVLFIGCSNGMVISGQPHASNVVKIVITSDGTGTPSFFHLTANATINNTQVLPDNRSWWYDGNNTLGTANFDNPQITVDPDNVSRIFITGATGIYRSTDSGATWESATNGTPLFVAQDFALDPNSVEHCVISSEDYGALDVDVLTATEPTIVHNSPASSEKGYCLAFDPASSSNSVIYIGMGDKSANTNGQVFSRVSSPANSAWTTVGVLGSTDFLTKVGGNRPIGLYAGRDNSGSLFLLAVALGKGMYRWDGSNWTNVSSAIGSGGDPPGDFLNVTGSGAVIFAYDRKSGIVYRSQDYGQTWGPLFTQTTDAAATCGWISYNAGDDKLWLTGGTRGLWVLSSASTTTSSPSWIMNLPGSPFVGGVSTPSRGKVYVITLADSSHNTQIWGTTNGGTSWAQADDGSLAAVTAQPRRLRTRSDGVLVMSAGSDVVAWGQPLV